MTPDRVDQLRALSDQQVTRAEHHPRRLLLLALDRDEAHVRALRGLANRFGIGGIVLLTLYERLHISRRDQPNLVSDRHKLACPVMRAAACLHRDQTARLLPHELQQLASAQPAAEPLLAARIRPVRMKNTLRDIKTDCGNFRHGRLLQWCSTPPLWHIDAVGGRPPHQLLERGDRKLTVS